MTSNQPCECTVGAVFTYPADDAGIVEPYANDVQACGECRQHPGDLEAARALALHLGRNLLPGEYPNLAFIASAWGPDGHLAPGGQSIIIRGDYPEACMDGHNLIPEGGYLRIEEIELPAPSPEDRPRHPEDDARSAGLFEAVVELSRLYVSSLDGTDPIGCLLIGLRENLEHEL